MTAFAVLVQPPCAYAFKAWRSTIAGCVALSVILAMHCLCVLVQLASGCGCPLLVIGLGRQMAGHDVGPNVQQLGDAGCAAQGLPLILCVPLIGYKALFGFSVTWHFTASPCQ